MMEQIDLFISQFYALPTVENIVNSNGILRLAVLQYGKPLFLITVAFIVLVLILLIARLEPLIRRQKRIEEAAKKPEKPAPETSKRAKNPQGTPNAVLKKLAKLPASTLPLYSVAKNHETLSLDPDPAPISDVAPDMELPTITPAINDHSLAADDDFAMPTFDHNGATIDREDFDSNNLLNADQTPDLTTIIDQDANDECPADMGIDRPTDEHLDGAPQHEVTLDISPIGGDDFDMPIGSFGRDNTDGDVDESADENTDENTDENANENADENASGLSASAQKKLAELNDRGTV